MIELSDLKLGQRVGFSIKLKRKWNICEDQDVKFWMAVHCNYTDGIVIGIRTLSDGNVEFGSNEDGTTQYRPVSHFQAVLVAHSLHRKPVLVLPQDLEVLEPTNIVPGREPKVHKMAPSSTRKRDRSKTYDGVAAAIVAQWGILTEKK